MRSRLSTGGSERGQRHRGGDGAIVAAPRASRESVHCVSLEGWQPLDARRKRDHCDAGYRLCRSRRLERINVVAAATARFSNVAISKPTGGNKPPTVSISSPVTGASFTAPARFLSRRLPAMSMGRSRSVSFYAGTLLLGSDSTYPFSTTWSNVPAGQYSLKAVATDNASGSATSFPIAVSVAAAPGSPRPTKVVFVPPTNYATAVTSYTAQLRRAVDPKTATPVASKNLGKPGVVSGEISADISSIVDPLPAGSYYAVIVSTGAGGSTPSAPSPSFTK